MLVKEQVTLLAVNSDKCTVCSEWKVVYQSVLNESFILFHLTSVLALNNQEKANGSNIKDYPENAFNSLF